MSEVSPDAAFKEWYDEGEHDLYNYPEEAVRAAWDHQQVVIDALRSELAAAQQRVAELEKQAPDYQRVKRAIRLAETEYVGQHWGTLWQWAWEESEQTKTTTP